MGRGLSQLQRDILDVLARSSNRQFIGTVDVIDRLGRERSRGSYSAVSKALHRLQQRKLVVVWVPEIWRPDKGYGYSLRNE